MIRHVVLITLKPDADEKARDTIVEELRKLPEQISAIRNFEVGVGINPGNATIAVVGLFDDTQGQEEYRDHPAHQAVVSEHIQPVRESSKSIQFEV